MNVVKVITLLMTSCLLFSFVFLSGRCEFCNGQYVGTTCSKSSNPVGTCIIVREGKCSYCGGSYAGTSCSKSPVGTCVVPKAKKCSYCAGSLLGTTCSKKSPTGKCVSVRY
ncbi:hypothetical protein [Aureispira anguillae]|uniref:Uncharacterized protein n=1 Tax=Aureispira anguillae TaxID=2864201 RepID=A0A915YBR5_9BACT|nr:hypothetical protein [Aureispira anguillae]BDS10158.1 hypothetical protein AsAng_0008660 [Aureispira anguillae]